MNINVVDIVIILMIALGGVLGFKAGVIKKITQFVGLFVIVIISFSLKNTISTMFYENLPFFDFFGIISGIGVINVLLYEILAFVLVFLALTMILKIVVTITGLVEWIIKFNVFLSLPSKVLGIFVGILESYVYIFLALVILNLPVFNLDIVRNSEFANFIVNETPVLSGASKDMIDTYALVYESIENKGNKTNATVNEEVLDILIDQGVVTEDSAMLLIEKNKILVSDDYYLKEKLND